MRFVGVVPTEKLSLSSHTVHCFYYGLMASTVHPHAFSVLVWCSYFAILGIVGAGRIARRVEIESYLRDSSLTPPQLRMLRDLGFRHMCYRLHCNIKGRIVRCRVPFCFSSRHGHERLINV